LGVTAPATIDIGKVELDVRLAAVLFLNKVSKTLFVFIQNYF
jgi:hypothetical protein